MMSVKRFAFHGFSEEFTSPTDSKGKIKKKPKPKYKRIEMCEVKRRVSAERPR